MAGLERHRTLCDKRAAVAHVAKRVAAVLRFSAPHSDASCSDITGLRCQPSMGHAWTLSGAGDASVRRNEFAQTSIADSNLPGN